MRSPPAILRGLLPKLYLIPPSCTNLLPRQSRFLSSPCAALDDIEFSHSRTNMGFTGGIISQQSQFSSKRCKRLSTDLHLPDSLKLKYLGNFIEKGSKIRVGNNFNTLGAGWAVKFDGRKKLKWYSERMNHCAMHLSLKEGNAVHGKLIRSGLDPDMHLWVSLINFYTKCRSLTFARCVFDQMPERDVVSWTTLIGGFVAEGYGSNGIKLFCDMRREGIKPNEFTLATVLKACSSLLDLEAGKQMHVEVIKGGVFSDLYVGSALVDLYAKCGYMEYADKVFLFIPELNVVSWNALLNGYAEIGDGNNVLRLFCELTEREMKFSKFTLSTTIKGCANSGYLRAGQVLHSMAIKVGGESYEYISCSLADMYSKCDMAVDALKIFMRIENLDSVAWNTMLSGYANAVQGEKAIQCFSQMQKEGVKPTEFTLAACLKASSRMASLENGRQLHSFAIKTGHSGDIFVASALVDMYARSGCIDDAETFFNSTNSRDTVLWNTIICGYSQHGEGGKALEAFKIMLDEGAFPDGITFLCILSACSHMGLVEEGRDHFLSMSDIYGIAPSMNHYACMVDLLGRAGKHDEVENVIQEMKLTPTALIWETVLGVCQIHGNIELTERAAKRLSEIEPQNGFNLYTVI